MICPYCGKKAALVNGLVIYPKRPDLSSLSFYQCAPCNAYVGCHKGTTKPLGRLADAELRKWKRAAHSQFDKIWKGFKERNLGDVKEMTFSNPFEAPKTQGRMSRGMAYKYLAESLGIQQDACHIGMFTVDLCKRAYGIAKDGFKHEHKSMAEAFEKLSNAEIYYLLHDGNV